VTVDLISLSFHSKITHAVNHPWLKNLGSPAINK
jgi:hypothetical protein